MIQTQTTIRSLTSSFFRSKAMTWALLMTFCSTNFADAVDKKKNGSVQQKSRRKKNVVDLDQTGIRVSNRPKVPGKLLVRLRSRVETEKGSGKIQPVVREEEWNASETMIIICDMWDGHYCLQAAQRVDMMAPKMNRVITAARNHGVMIVHAPSGTINHYELTQYRKRMKQAEYAKPPVPIQGWCYLNPDKEAKMPVDTTKSPCDDPIVGAAVQRFTKQHAGIKIIGYDGVSDKGQEIYNFIHQEGIKNVVLMGVHTNMCVLGRPFGLRQMKYLGLNVALARNLTDAMYDPREYPYVSHTRGTQLVIEHIERYWNPSLDSVDLTKIIPGSADPDPEVAKSKQPKKAVVTAAEK
jgi:nicotinamidase-related amidase